MSRQPGLLTSEEFAALHVEGVRLELIRGELCVMPPAFADHGETVGALHAILGAYVRTYNLGKMYSAETGFLVARNPDSIRTTDIAFIQRNRLTPEAVAPTWNPVMPDLVVEVVASRDRAPEIAGKVEMWIEAGVRMVWVVYRLRRTVEIFQPHRQMLLVSEHEQLTGTDVIPGFFTPVAAIFAE